MEPRRFEQDYKNLLDHCWQFGYKETEGRNGPTMVIFGKSIEFDFRKGLFPLIMGKRVFFEKGAAEAEWMLRGQTNVDFLKHHKVFWWNDFADENGELGKTYGYQMVKFGGEFNQVHYCVDQINSNSRRAVITFWNPIDNLETSLPPCYTSMTFVRMGKHLHCDFALRSSDLFLGLPYDFIVGAMILFRMCRKTNLEPGRIRYNLANAHIYLNHEEPLKQYMNYKHSGSPDIRELESGDYAERQGPFIKAKLNL